MPVHIVNPRHKKTADLIDTTSRSLNWSRGLSPFVLGPVELPCGGEARNVENAWQYSKVYKHHVGEDGLPSPEWYRWAASGYVSAKADRYPMGKGVRPEYSWWGDKKYGYIEARKKIYVPIYSRCVLKSSAFKKLKEVLDEQGDVYLWDFDGYDYEKEGMSLLDVLNCETRKMGHCFVLALLLTPQEDWGRRPGETREQALERLRGGDEAQENEPEELPGNDPDDRHGPAVDLGDVVDGGALPAEPDPSGSQGGDPGGSSGKGGVPLPLDQEGLRALIVERLFDTMECRSSVVTYHNEGILRGLIWALTGEDPGHLSKTAKILNLVGVPYELAGSGDLYIDEGWLRSHGIATE